MGIVMRGPLLALTLLLVGCCQEINSQWSKEKEGYGEKKIKKNDGEEKFKKEFTFKCEQGLSTNCGENGKCQISCGDGKKFEMTCAKNESIESIENVNGVSRIRCGKKVEFPPCFPFCNKANPLHNSGSYGTSGNRHFGDSFSAKTPVQVPTFKPCFPFCNKNGGGYNQPSKPVNNKFPPCFPFCNNNEGGYNQPNKPANNNRVGYNQPSKPVNNNPMFPPCFPFCNNNQVGYNQPRNVNSMFPPCFPFC